MQQGIESTPLPLDVESSFEDSFALVSPFRSDGCDGERIVFVGESNVERSECYKFQPLPSPFGLSLELDMEQEFFRTDFDEDCKVVGPTLAELNDHRSLSPLINPEMERLHRIAMRTEGDVLFSSGYTPRRPQAYIALEHSVERTGKPIIQVKKESLDSSSECCERHGNPLGVVNERVPREVSCSAPTWTVTHSSTSWRGNDATKETSSTEDGRSRHKFTLEEKLENEVIVQVPTLGSTQMKDDISSESAKNGTIKTEEISTEHDSCATDPGSPAVDDESGEEEMESDEDFEVEDHSQESGLVRNRKGRRGESDDLSPNPRKLLEISRELDRLNKVIGDLKPINKLPQNARNKSRKEKNKLASRACRLKKKAQHEANKVKLHGLELEQQRLTEVIDKVKKEILKGSSKPVVQRGSLSSHVEGLIKATFGNQLVAGHTSDFVHSVLKATARSNPSMEGLGELSMCF